MELEMREVGNFFKGKGISISTDNAWLRSCVECFKSECSNYKKKELFDFVYEQWLLADLREIRSHSLPKECRTLDKYTILGKHAVQLNYTIDISRSSYDQLQTIRHPGFAPDTENDDSEGKPTFTEKRTGGKRSLKIEISDGEITVLGFEDRHISTLTNPVPGEKAILKGPIECRKGVLMLTEKNIEILGGEVDTLLIPNALENILARLLGQPESQNPYKQLSTSIPSTENNGLPSDTFDQDDEALVMVAQSVEMSQSTPQTLQLVTDNSIESDDDFDLLAAQTASLAEFHATQRNRQNSVHPITNISNSTKTVTSNQTNTITSNCSIDNINYVDMNNPKRLKRELQQSYGSLVSNGQKQPGLSDKNKCCNTSTSNNPGSSSSSNFNKEVNSKTLKEVTPTWTTNKWQEPQTSCAEEDECPSWYNEDFNEMDSQENDSERFSENNSESFYEPYPPRKFPALRTVNGKVVRLSEKLTMKNGQWNLSAIILAKGLEIEMNFASEVLDRIFGVTAAELISRKNDLKSNPVAKEQMNKLLRDSQLKIKNLNCEMVIRFQSVIATPLIIDVIEK